ncbi:MAG TPA: M56 family metallopeptidase, partial [Pyrinomonadaceae bacterium]
MSGPHEFLARASAWLWPALVDHLWQSALFAALVFAATLLVRRGPARARHALWLVALVKFAVPPALFAFLAARAGLDASWLFENQSAAATEYAPLVMQLTEPVATLSNSAGATLAGGAAHGEIHCALTLAWLAGCASLLFMRLRRRREFVRALGAGSEVYAGREFDAMERARRRLGLERDARLMLSSHGAEPGVWRTRTPVVVLPETLSAHLDEEELESLMLHELSHVERRDNLIGSLQTTLTCVFWFCPPVWLVSRRLLEERERACDERVLEAGGASAPYASSILKVVRFCSGWKVAGVSGAAAGPNLRRRIEDIMEARTTPERTAWQRTLPLAAAVAALALSAGAGVYSYGQSGGGVRGAAARQQAQAGGGAKGGARVRVVPLNEAEGVAAQEIEQTPEASVRFDNAGDAPLVITEARMRMVTREQVKRGDDEGAEKHGLFLTMPSVTVANFTAKTVKEIGLGFVIDGSANVIMGRRASLKPGESQTFLSEWNRVNVILPGTPADVVVRVVWVEFTDGTQWGARSRPPLAPGPPPPPGGIGAARGTMPPPPPPADAPTGHAPADLPPTGEPPADVPPPSQGQGSAAGPIVVRGGSGEGVGAGAGAGAGAGTGQGGGTGAGANVNGGILNQRTRSQPQPAYPPIARAARAQGTVAVRIVIDEEGKVISAEAVNGHPLLRAAAVEAARAATVAPTRLSGPPVKVTGPHT